MISPRTRTRIAILAAATVFALTGCASASDTSDSSDTSGTPANSAAATPAAESLSLEDAWVKAADSGMSAVFGTFENSSDTDITVVSVESATSNVIELHETVADDSGSMIMQQKEGGYVVPANGSFELAPGGNHIMLMGLTAALPAGTESTFTLTLSDGSEISATATAKDFSGANESYEGDTETDMETDTEMNTDTEMDTAN